MASYHLCVKTGKRGSAATHSAYITRSGAHAKKRGADHVIATGHGNLPSWANEDPKALWKAADRYERSNGSTYTEFELALPSELSKEQNVDLIGDFIAKQVGERPYQFAMHAPVASIGNVPQPHVHVMVNNRIADGIERTPEQHFRRFNPDSPELGGCKKSAGGKSPSEVRSAMAEVRESWATIQNEHLAKHGHDIRVDHRSLRDRGIGRNPERHLGPARIKQMSTEDKAQHAARRLG